jgi:hypothetical protein
MCQKNPGHGPAQIAGERVHRVTCHRRGSAPGTGELALLPSGPLASPPRSVSKKANANHVSYTNSEITS